MNFLTNFADEAVVLPLVVGIAVTLLALKWRRGAVAWLIAVGGTLAAMFVLKVVGIACGPDLLRTPSGHTAAAAVVCGGLAMILARGSARWVLLAALLAAVVIGASRLALGAHTVPEVILGGLVGASGAVLLARLAGRPPEGFRVGIVAGIAVMLLALFHGERLPAETPIHGIAYQIARELEVCRGSPAWRWENAAQQRPYVSSIRMISSSPR
ncbi:MAG TPA: phosphatase PAP2 family protein [Acetobacteraceae bacterium]